MTDDSRTAGDAAWYQAVADSYLFRSLDAQERALLLRVGAEIAVDAGEVILHQGEECDAFFFILDGTVKVSTSKGTDVIPLAELERGSLLGEVATLTGGTRTATAVALTQTRLVRFPAKAIHAVLENNPKIKKLIEKVVARRAEDTIEKTLQ